MRRMGEAACNRSRKLPTKTEVEQTPADRQCGYPVA